MTYMCMCIVFAASYDFLNTTCLFVSNAKVQCMDLHASNTKKWGQLIHVLDATQPCAHGFFNDLSVTNYSSLMIYQSQTIVL